MPTLSLRASTGLDFPPIACLIKDHASKFLDDYEESIDQAELLALLQAGEIIVVDDSGYPVGGFWFNTPIADLSVEIHFICQPALLLRAYRSGLIDKAIGRAFKIYGVKKIKARVMTSQNGAIWLLQKMKFKQNGLLRNETRHFGKVVDVFLFELHRKFYEKHHKGNP